MRDGIYRTSGGTPCPMCGKPLLLADAEQAVACSGGCGTWYPWSALEQLIEPEALTSSARHWWRHGEPRQCLRCGAKMLVVGRDAATLEMCQDHGLWLAAARRAAFEKAFRRELKARVGWVRPAAAAPARGSAKERALAQEIAGLKARLASLEVEFSTLRRRR